MTFKVIQDQWKWHESTGLMTLPMQQQRVYLSPFLRYHTTTFTQYVTICNLKESFIFDKQLGLKAADASRLMYTHTHIVV